MTSDTLLPAIEIETSPHPSTSVIWMHGLGADGSDFVPIVQELALPPRPGIRFVFPHAPKRPVTINGGYVMRAWYDVKGPRIEDRQDAEGMEASRRAIENLIEREKERGTPARCILLAGFSQGGAVALHTGLRYSQPLAGILALSTYLPLPETLEREAHPANAAIPIFMAHGTLDPIVPLPLALTSRERLARLGYQVEWHEYPMPHSVCAEEIADLSAWLKKTLTASEA